VCCLMSREGASLVARWNIGTNELLFAHSTSPTEFGNGGLHFFPSQKTLSLRQINANVPIVAAMFFFHKKNRGKPQIPVNFPPPPFLGSNFGLSNLIFQQLRLPLVPLGPQGTKKPIP